MALAESSTSISSGRVSGDDVVDERDPLVEEVPAAGLEVAAHAVVGQPLPLQTGDQLARDVKGRWSRKANVWLGGSFIDRTLTTRAADQQVIAVALDAESATK